MGGADAHGVPNGFVELPCAGAADFGTRNLALFARADDGKLTMGFRILDHHLNLGGICHGGLIATFCDVHLVFAALFEARMTMTALPTISLSIDYLRPGQAGQWVQATGDILRRGRNLVFAQTVALADGIPLARASGVYKIGASGADGVATGVSLRDIVESR